MCHYLGGGLHGRQKRVKAQSESSKSVVNSVLISREMPVFPGFLEIIRVVNKNSKALITERMMFLVSYLTVMQPIIHLRACHLCFSSAMRRVISVS